MFDINKILLENDRPKLSDQLVNSQKDLPKNIDDFYQKKIEDLSDNMIKNHKEFLNKEKDIFQATWNTLKYSKGSVDSQYKILMSKYDIYNKNVFGSLDHDMNQIAVFMMSANKDIKFQRNLIQKFIDEKHIIIQQARFEIEPIAFSTCFLPTSESMITSVLDSSNENINIWFMDENRILERMINELKLYSNAEIATSEKIIKIYDQYIIDLQKYFKNYTNYTNTLKNDLEKYIDKKQDEYKKDLNAVDGEARQLILNKLRIMMDRYFHILKMITFHYNIQIKFIFESFKSCSRNMQKVYDFLMMNYK